MADGTLLNARDIATLFWLITIALFFIVAAPADVGRLLRLALWSRLAFIWLAYLICLTCVVLGLRRLGLDYPGATKDAVAWGLFVGLPVLTKFASLGRDPGLLKRALRGAVAGTVLVEFFVNLYVFPLPVEIVLLPLIAVLYAMTALENGQAQHVSLRGVGQWGLAVVGCVVLGYVAWRVGSEPSAISVPDSVLKLVQPVLLTVAVVALTLLVAVYAAYETVVVHMRIAEPRHARPPRGAILALASVLHLRVSRVHGFAGNLPRQLKSASTFGAARRLAIAYRDGRTDQSGHEGSTI